MRKISTFAILLGFPLLTIAQNVGMGTNTPNASAKLDITDANRGILIPRVALTATNLAGPITAPATSLMVYNNATAGVAPNNVTPGFYYWDGAKWVRFASGNAGWDLLGNAGTVAGTNFIGTTDAVDFVARTSNTERMRITSAGNVGIGDATPAALFTVGNGDLFQVLSTGHARSIYGSAAAPPFSFTGDPDCGLYHTALADDIGISTGGTQRLWISDAGEVYVGATAPVLPGDLFSATASNTNAVTSGSGNLTWAINGYSAYNGGCIYGLRLNGSTGVWGSGQFEIQSAMTVATAKGVYGTCAANTQYGVNGFKPSGGTGWGGLFQNDLGYTGFFGAASDRSLKKNIQSFNGALAILSQLPIYSYQYKTEQYDVLGDDATHYGVMADELKQLFPALVKTKTLAAGTIRSLDADKQPRGVEGEVDLVNYIELVPIAVQAIKEQQKLIEEQRQMIEELRKEVNALKNK